MVFSLNTDRPWQFKPAYIFRVIKWHIRQSLRKVSPRAQKQPKLFELPNELLVQIAENIGSRHEELLPLNRACQRLRNLTKVPLLRLALQSGDESSLSELHNPPANVCQQAPVLLWAILHGRTDLALEILDTNEPTAKDTANPARSLQLYNALLLATIMRDGVAVLRLLEYGADPNLDVKETRYRTTPLIVAVAWRQNQAMIPVLLRFGADPSFQWGKGRDNVRYATRAVLSLFAAIRAKNKDAVQILLEAGADPRELDNHFVSMFTYALAMENVDRSDHTKSIMSLFLAHDTSLRDEEIHYRNAAMITRLWFGLWNPFLKQFWGDQTENRDDYGESTLRRFLGRPSRCSACDNLSSYLNKKLKLWVSW